MRTSVLFFFSLAFLFVTNTYANKLSPTGSPRFIKPTDSCIENSIFKSKYFKSIQYIQDYVEGKRKDRKDFGKSIDNVIRNSGIRSSVYYGYIFRYRKKTDFYADKMKWLLWYESNKCNNLHWR
ncbi:hypothetical protein DBR11_25435 [Pedobacter sp. HMWF019]|nr:hypothetical protein DBR11_25435 [Pedobacter sp. HMWF019]